MSILCIHARLYIPVRASMLYTHEIFMQIPVHVYTCTCMYELLNSHVYTIMLYFDGHPSTIVYIYTYNYNCIVAYLGPQLTGCNNHMHTYIIIYIWKGCCIIKSYNCIVGAPIDWL